MFEVIEMAEARIVAEPVSDLAMEVKPAFIEASKNTIMVNPYAEITVMEFDSVIDKLDVVMSTNECWNRMRVGSCGGDGVG